MTSISNWFSTTFRLQICFKTTNGRVIKFSFFFFSITTLALEPCRLSKTCLENAVLWHDISNLLRWKPRKKGERKSSSQRDTILALNTLLSFGRTFQHADILKMLSYCSRCSLGLGKATSVVFFHPFIFVFHCYTNVNTIRCDRLGKNWLSCSPESRQNPRQSRKKRLFFLFDPPKNIRQKPRTDHRAKFLKSPNNDRSDMYISSVTGIRITKNKSLFF